MQTSNQIGRITTEGTISDFPIPTAASGPWGIALGPDNNLWFTEQAANQIARMLGNDPDTVDEFTIPTAASGAQNITSGSDGNLWFTEMAASRIGRITPAGVITEFPLPAGRGPIGITAGPDGNVWFASRAAGGSGGSPRARPTRKARSSSS